MATRTISNAGGNYNATGTWVEGVVPTSADDVVATATSGQLTVNVASAARSINLTNYANTITMNANLTLATASVTNTLGDTSTNYAGTAGIIICNAAMTLVQNNTNRIPILQFGTGTKTLNTNLYVAKITVNTTGIAINGNTIYCNSDFGLLTSTAIPGVYSVGTTSFVLDGSGLISYAGSNTVTINTSGQYDTMGRGLVLGTNAVGSTGTFNFTSGTTGVFNCILTKSVGNTDNYTLNLNKSTVNLLVETKSVNSSTPQMNITLTGPLNVNTLGSFSTDRIYTTDATPVNATFSGNSISATTLNLKPAFRTTSSTTFPVASNGQTNQAINIKLDQNYTHTFGSMILSGGVDKATISSITGGVQVPINLGDKETSQIINYNFTDVNASGGEQIVAINGTLSGTTNITTTYPSGGGGGGGSFTFVN
jgi:hypothetical protein